MMGHLDVIGGPFSVWLSDLCADIATIYNLFQGAWNIFSILKGNNRCVDIKYS